MQPNSTCAASSTRYSIPCSPGMAAPRARRFALPRPNNSLQLTRLACGKLGGDLPAELRENGWRVARAAGQLSSRPLCAKQAWRFLAGWKSLSGKA